MIYLASPYSHEDPIVCEQRYEAACRATAGLLRRGHPVFSPVVHSHPLVRYGLPGDWDFWERCDRALLRCCREMIVLMLDGWRESRGVQAEIDLAIEMELPIRYLAADRISNSSGGETNISERPLSQATSIWIQTSPPEP